jgi:hypothetical protein
VLPSGEPRQRLQCLRAMLQELCGVALPEAAPVQPPSQKRRLLTPIIARSRADGPRAAGDCIAELKCLQQQAAESLLPPEEVSALKSTSCVLPAAICRRGH